MNILPSNWSWVKLGELVTNPKSDIVDGPFGSDLKSSEYQSSGIPIIRLQNIDRHSFIDKNIKFINPSKAKELNRHNFRAGDIVLTKLGDPLGKACLVPQKYQNGIIVADIVRIRNLKKIIDKEFLLKSINSEYIAKQLKIKTKGTTRPRVNLTHVRNLELKLPPLPEQKKIVEKIEELFSGLDSGVASLKKAKEQIRLYRQSVLASAFSGKLVKDEKRETKNELEAYLNGFQGVNKAAEPKEKYSNQLPDGWKWVKLGDVSLKITDGEHLRPKVQVNGIPFLSAKDVRENDVTFENVLYVSENDAEMFRKKCNPEKGDILIVSRGATVGRLCIIKTEKIFCLLGSVILIKVNKKIHSGFIAYMIKSPQLNKQIINVSGSTAQQAIYLRDIKSVEIPLPSFVQQTQIVEEIEKRFSEADNLEKAIDESLTKSETLRQSILKQAFEGKLV